MYVYSQVINVQEACLHTYKIFEEVDCFFSCLKI